jgi:hypothetical protein
MCRKTLSEELIVLLYSSTIENNSYVSRALAHHKHNSLSLNLLTFKVPKNRFRQDGNDSWAF